ncbi:MAG: hypothetical protein JRL30_05035 [Deltaproteobacteria bacterium]|nr:hypothetical protein [Deltaproteobacteria bacterium]
MKRKRKTRKELSPRTPLSQEHQALIALLLQEMAGTDPVDIAQKVPDARCAQALIDGLPLKDASAIPLLLALRAGFKEKAVTKAIKRAVFKLKRRGVPTAAFDAEDSASPSILKPLKKEDPLCYVGPVYGFGFRGVLVILDRGVRGLDIGFGIVSDEEGIQEFLFNTVSKSRAKAFKEEISAQVGPLVETSLSHAATILEESYQKHLALKSEVPAGYLELRPWLLENTTLLRRPIIYELIPEASDSETTLSGTRLWDLFDHALMDSWLIDPDALRPFMADMQNVHESPIVLTEAQKSARIREIKETCMTEIFPAEKRDVLKQRLEEMGYIFFKLGQEETAGVALAAAHRVVQDASLLKTNPVIEILLERGMGFYKKAMEERGAEHGNNEDNASPLILP